MANRSLENDGQSGKFILFYLLYWYNEDTIVPSSYSELLVQSF